MRASSSTELCWKPRRVSSKWISHYGLLKCCCSTTVAGEAPDPLSLLFWSSTSKTRYYASPQVSRPSTKPLCLLKKRPCLAAMLRRSRSHIPAPQPRTCPLSCLRMMDYMPRTSLRLTSALPVQLSLLDMKEVVTEWRRPLGRSGPTRAHAGRLQQATLFSDKLQGGGSTASLVHKDTFKHEIKLSNTPKGYLLGVKLTSCKSAPRTSRSMVALRDTCLFHRAGRGPVLDMNQV